MVDRIAPATTPADIDSGRAALRLSRPRGGGRRAVPPMGDREPLRRPIAAAGISPARSFVDDVTPFEHLKMRVLNARADHARLPRRCSPAMSTPSTPWPTRCSPTSSAACWSRRALPTLAAGAGHRRRSPMSSRASTGCATPRSATATTRSPPTARRRSSSGCSTRSASGCARGEGVACLPVAVAAWMAYLVRAVDALRPRWTADDPYAGRDRRDRRPRRRRPGGAGRRASSAIDSIFDPALAGRRRLPRRRRARP